MVPQDGTRVRRLVPIELEVLREQIESVAAEHVAAWKVGLLPTAEHVDAVLETHDRIGRPILVHDPVIWSGDGFELVRSGAMNRLRRLLRRARVSTPNHKEAVALAGHDTEPAQLARELAPEDGWCVVTGGDAATSRVTDWASDGERVFPFERERVDCGWVRGTGCAMSTAMACYLAQGAELPDAIGIAGDWLAGQLGAAIPGASGGGGRLP